MEATSADPQAGSPTQTAKEAELQGYALIEDVMQRQEQAIAQLDELNTQIEQAIEALIAARREADPELSELAQSDDTTVPDSIDATRDERTSDLRRAA